MNATDEARPRPRQRWRALVVVLAGVPLIAACRAFDDPPPALVIGVVLAFVGLARVLARVVQRGVAGWPPRQERALAAGLIAQGLTTGLPFVLQAQGIYVRGALAGGPGAGFEALGAALQDRDARDVFVLGLVFGLTLGGAVGASVHAEVLRVEPPGFHDLEAGRHMRWLACSAVAAPVLLLLVHWVASDRSLRGLGLPLLGGPLGGLALLVGQVLALVVVVPVDALVDRAGGALERLASRGAT